MSAIRLGHLLLVICRVGADRMIDIPQRHFCLHASIDAAFLMSEHPGLLQEKDELDMSEAAVSVAQG